MVNRVMFSIFTFFTKKEPGIIAAFSVEGKMPKKWNFR